MALNKLTPESFNRKIQFGVTKTVPNLNTGGSKTEFVATDGLNLWCAPYTRSISLQYQLSATDRENIVIVIRHNTQVNKNFKAMYQGTLYEVVDDSLDDSNHYVTYDYITLKKVSKG